jgi:hypothetical protein
MTKVTGPVQSVISIFYRKSQGVSVEVTEVTEPDAMLHPAPKGRYSWFT